MILDLFKLNGKAGVVTGAGGPFGDAIARGLVEAGAAVLLVGPEGACGEPAPAAGAPGRCIGMASGLKTPEDAQAVAARALAEFGQIDFLFAADAYCPPYDALEGGEEEFDEIVARNLDSAFLMTQSAAAAMIKAERPGLIAFTSSVFALQGGMGISPYAYSSGALHQMAKSLGVEWGNRGIRVVALGPGYFETDGGDVFPDPGQTEETLKRIPLGRFGTTRELAALAVFLASDACPYLTTRTIYVDGGYLVEA